MAQTAKPGWVSRPPSAGAIVTCLYPNDPKGELRPCLVLETLSGSKSGYAVRVAFGTKSLKKDTRGAIDLIVESQGDIDTCGLAVATRFDLENTAIIPWDLPDCGCWRGQYTPILGWLPRSHQIDCGFKLGAIQAKNKV
jgi:hypothetical protein